MKKEIVDNVHAWISVGCPSGSHADFRIDERKTDLYVIIVKLILLKK